MKKTVVKAVGFLCYMILVGVLFNFDWPLLFQPRPFFSVLLGMVLLTASQYKKTYSRDDILASTAWNLLFASFLTTLVSLLSTVPSRSLADMTGHQLAGALLPMLYGSMLYLLLNLILREDGNAGSALREAPARGEVQALISAAASEQVFRDFGLTGRECHVALKLLENISNKEIGSQLYISEATVKKHIQNIYQKVGATDRNSFREVYLSSAKQK